MKHAVIGLTLAVLAATTGVAHAQDATPPAAGAAGNIEKASGFAAGDISTVLAVGLGASTAIAVLVIGAEGGGSTATATSTSTSTAR
ncbi:hypothetical protein [Nevskia sp.]|uniref:hypothetical protein n=1 Tax=Nevskia sp. TaxID=1929292 RepID=UPI0025F0E338|nr:hypothetical protein [Nevskia sp.]